MTTDFFDKAMDVDSSFGILGSTRRGMSVHARNVGVSKEALKTFHCWSNEMNSCMGGSCLDMPDTYSALNGDQRHVT